MSKETDEFYRRGVKYGFRAGYYSAIREMQKSLNSAQAYDRNEKRVIREAYHIKDIVFTNGMMAYEVSKCRIKDYFESEEGK